MLKLLTKNIKFPLTLFNDGKKWTFMFLHNLLYYSPKASLRYIAISACIFAAGYFFVLLKTLL